MSSFAGLALRACLILVLGFFVVVVWKLLTGGIALDQLLQGDVRDPNSQDDFTTRVSAGRVQALSVTLFAALYYLLQVIHNPTQFPKLPNGLIGVVAGSQGLYLLGKAKGLLLPRLRDLLK